MKPEDVKIEPSLSPYYPDGYAVLIRVKGAWRFIDQFSTRESAE